MQVRVVLLYYYYANNVYKKRGKVLNFNTFKMLYLFNPGLITFKKEMPKLYTEQ